jgi:hypothetical protein
MYESGLGIDFTFAVGDDDEFFTDMIADFLDFLSQ